MFQYGERDDSRESSWRQKSVGGPRGNGRTGEDIAGTANHEAWTSLPDTIVPFYLLIVAYGGFAFCMDSISEFLVGGEHSDGLLGGDSTIVAVLAFALGWAFTLMYYSLSHGFRFAMLQSVREGGSFPWRCYLVAFRKSIQLGVVASVAFAGVLAALPLALISDWLALLVAISLGIYVNLGLTLAPMLVLDRGSRLGCASGNWHRATTKLIRARGICNGSAWQYA
jgi:hypothetical protein